MSRAVFRSTLMASALIALSACGGADAPATPSNAAPSAGKSALLADGQISGFGSVFIDGQRFDTSTAKVMLNGSQGSESDLEQGMEARVFGRDGKADRLEMDDRLRGEIQSIDADAQSFTVLDTVVLVDEQTVFRGTRFADLAVGDQVAVAGPSNADGAIQASFVGTPRGTADGAQLRGRIAALDETRLQFRLGRVLVDYSAAELIDSPDGLANGDAVRVMGSRLASAEVPTFSARQIKELERDLPSDRVVRIRGLISAIQGEGIYTVRNRSIRITQATEFRQGSEADMQIDTPVVASGRFNPEEQIFDVEQIAVLRRINGVVEAQVEAIDRENRLITVLGGLQIHVPEVVGHAEPEVSNAAARPERDRRFRFEDVELRLGLRVVGHWDGQQLVARHLHRSRLREGQAFVGGHIERLEPDAQRLSILGRPVAVSEDTRFSSADSPQAFFASATVGDRIGALGAWDGSQLNARAIRHGSGGDERPRLDRVEPARDNAEVAQDS